MLRRTTSEIAQKQIDQLAAAFSGRRLEAISKEDPSWLFVFGPQTSIRTSSAWRFGDAERTIVTSEDDGQWFGLPAPLDAAEWLLSRVRDLAVSSVSVPDATGDLLILFGDVFELQFLQMSGGYEAWAAYAGASEIICYGGGKLD